MKYDVIIVGGGVSGTAVNKIIRQGENYMLQTDNGSFEAGAVVVSAGSHSLKFAKALGYGKDYSILSMAGSFYTGPKLLNGKVYTMQVPKLPFAAVHGDPEVHNDKITRFGPTAKPIFFLERYNYSTFWEYWKTFGFGIKSILIINNTTKKLELGEAKLVGEKIIFNITPSPGASTCLGNAFEDASTLMEFLGNRFRFSKDLFEKDLVKPSESSIKNVPS